MRAVLLSGVFGLPMLLLAACSLLTSTDGLAGGNAPRDSGSAGVADGTVVTTAPPVGAGDSSTEDAGEPLDSGASGAASAAYRAALLADDPVAYFRFEDLTGSGCVDEVAGSRFACAYSATGVARGAPGVAGSKSVRLDGQGTVVLAEDSLNFAKPLTLEFWIELDTPAPGQGIAAAMVNIDDSTRIGFTAFIYDDGAFRTENWNVNFQTYTLGGSPLTATSWHHIVIGHDATNLDADFSYVDGVKCSGGDSHDDAGDGTVTIPLVFGTFVGRIDELAWYDHPLTPARVLAHYSLN